MIAERVAERFKVGTIDEKGFEYVGNIRAEPGTNPELYAEQQGIVARYNETYGEQNVALRPDAFQPDGIPRPDLKAVWVRKSLTSKAA